MKSYFPFFRQHHSAVLLLLAFSSGLPLALTSSTLQTWMASEEIDLKTIGIFSLVGQAYVFKFLWAPFMDRYTPPFLGRRRGWLLICQGLLVFAILAMGWVNPTQQLGWLAVFAVTVAFCSASQDIVFDAYKTDLLTAQERGRGAALSVIGYRLAMLCSGGLALWLADRYFGWQSTYWLMAGLILLCMIVTLLAKEPDQPVCGPVNLKQAVVEPFRDFFGRNNAWLVLTLIVFYKIGDGFVSSLSITFLIRSVGFEVGEVGTWNNSLGLFATLLGVLFGGGLMQRLRLFNALMLFGILQAISNMGYWLLAITSKNLVTMGSVVFLENFCAGMGSAAFVALLMTLCNRSFSATQFALLSALASIGRVYIGPVAVWIVEFYGWAQLYLIATVAALPGLLVLAACRKSLEQVLSVAVDRKQTQ
ncbi:AmpG family muropeptide MFS transporter [Pseudomonas fluorescens]|uniref:AmpG family muropeptide MFS transporter n=1 Tax=Pseudomonas fluorescens TaxID=294 RepID=UPI001BE8EDA3|nr:MFS transporter [Pseudomonas fluorescens]MBT2375782.1 MFS transporter [Pseudomonas fluorescens]